MTMQLDDSAVTAPLPDHTQLPDSDGEFVKNFQEHPQSILLTDSILSHLDQRHPNGDYAIGQDCGIYWRQTDPPERGAEAPDWFYVPGVPPLVIDGKPRRSYVLWKELIAPVVVLEFASGNGDEERDQTPLAQLNGSRHKPGKFWIYEQIMRIPYYGIFEIIRERLSVYQLVNGRYQPLAPNAAGRFPITTLDLELGLWTGAYPSKAQPMRWLRWWSPSGEMLLTGQEEAERLQREVAVAQEEAAVAQEEAAVAQEEAAAERARAKRLAAYLRSQGLDPDAV